MKVGSIIKCVVSFEHLRSIWGFDYPKMGDILTISHLNPHPTREGKLHGILELYFTEKPKCIGLCDKQANGNHNFIELVPPIDLEKELSVSEELELK